MRWASSSAQSPAGHVEWISPVAPAPDVAVLAERLELVGRWVAQAEAGNRPSPRQVVEGHDLLGHLPGPPAGERRDDGTQHDPRRLAGDGAEHDPRIDDVEPELAV